MLQHSQQFNEHLFRQRVALALSKVRQILDGNRNPIFASDVHHAYEDKYTLTEMMVMLALASATQTLGVMGFSSETLRTLMDWSTKKSVSLRLKAQEKCIFVREVTRDVDSGERTETKARLGGLEAAFSSKVVTTVTEYVWNFEASYEVLALRGVGSEAADQIVVLSRSCSHEIITGSKSNPRVEAKTYPFSDVDISWILEHLNEDLSIKFQIDRKAHRNL